MPLAGFCESGGGVASQSSSTGQRPAFWGPDDPRRYHFKAIDGKFDWPNDKWASAHLPIVRMAVIACTKDWKESRAIAGKLWNAETKEWDPVVAMFFHEFDRVRDHLKSLIETIDAAEARWLLSCAAWGPPPEKLRQKK